MNLRNVDKNESFEITLEENPSTGYIWDLDSKEHFQILNVKRIVPEQNSEVVGGKIQIVFNLSAKQTGEYDLRFYLRRPWEKKTPILEYCEKVKVF